MRNYFIFWFWVVFSVCVFAVIGETIMMNNRKPPPARAETVNLQAMKIGNQNGFIVLHRDPRMRIAPYVRP